MRIPLLSTRRHPFGLAFASLTLLAVTASGAHAQGRIIGRSPVTRISGTTTVTLADRVLRYEITEIFRNDGGSVAEADYMFPLPAGAAFEDLRLSINGELVSGETMSADKARGIYEEIVRRQRDPALVEWMGGGMLRARIFPIQPGEEKKVVVRFQSVAVREGDALRIDYRRGTDPGGRSGGIGVRPVVSRIEDGREETGATWSRFTLVYPRSESYGTPYSPTHALRFAEDARTRRVEARGTAGEVTILLPLRRADVASMSVLTHANGNEPGFALVSLTPPAQAKRVTPRDLTFVLDVSGSMAGRKLTQAKAAGDAILESLRPGDRFRLVDFSTDVREFRAEWAPANAVNLRAAKRYIAGLRAEGSTNISEALRTALEVKPAEGRLPLVVFVTDGEPTVGERNPDAIAAIAAQHRRDARVFAVGVSTGVNAALIEQLALQGRGTAHFVRDEESVEGTVSLLARRLTAPVLTDVRITASGVRLSRVLPAGPIDVFAGQDLVVLARYDGSGDATIRLEGRSPTGPVVWTTRARFASETRSNAFVARLWAAQRIGWLAAEKRRGGRTGELDTEIRSLGERFGIPTEFSSYLVVEPGMSMASAAPRVRSEAASSRNASTGGTRAADGSGLSASVTQQSAAPTSVAPPSAARFEAARAAAMQREMKSVTALDDAASTAGARVVENRRFALANGVWTDAALRGDSRVVKVRPYSPLYFELVRRVSALSLVFALGDRVVVQGRRLAIELDPDGLERVDESVVATVVRDW